MRLNPRARNSSSIRTFVFPVVRNLRNPKSFFISPKAPSTWIERFIRNWIPLSLVMFSSDCARFSQKVSFIITSLSAFGSCFLQHFSLCRQFWQFSQRYHALVMGTPFFTSVETFLQYSFRPWAQIKQSSSLLYCIFSIRPIWDLYFFVFCAS